MSTVWVPQASAGTRLQSIDAQQDEIESLKRANFVNSVQASRKIHIQKLPEPVHQDQPSKTHEETPTHETLTKPDITLTANGSIHKIPSFVVPGSRPRKYIYPTIPVTNSRWSHDEFNQRYEVVVPELRRVIDEAKGLEQSPVNFQLRMVGVSPESATPSIVVTCRTSDCRPLYGLFRERATGRLYCHVQSKTFSLFKDFHLPKLRRDSDAPRPPFTLVLYPTDHPDLNRYSSPQEIKALATSDQTLCGALVQCQGNTATIGLSLEIDNDPVLLTVDHLFDSRTSTRALSDKSDRSDNSDNATLNDEDYVSLHELWAIDNNDTGWPEHDPIPTQHTEPCESGMNVEEEEQGSKCLPWRGERVEFPVELSADDPYLDVAIVKLDQETMSRRRRNLIYADGPSNPPTCLDKVAQAPRAHGTPVFIVSGVRGLRTGQLLKGFNYLSSKPGQHMCKTWSLILDALGDLVQGESGSIVVDSDTLEVYGHVVGADVFGHAHVVPLIHSIDQIQKAFNTTRIDLPSYKETVAGLYTPTKKTSTDPNQSSLSALDTAKPHALADLQLRNEPILGIGHPMEDFQLYVESRQETNYEGKNYMPLSALQKYWTTARIHKVLNVNRLWYQPEVIRAKYLRVFSTLVYANTSTSIREFEAADFSDKSLPLVYRPPWISSDDLFTRFDHFQWKFCPLEFKLGDFDRSIPPDAILPFQCKEDLTAGDNHPSKTWRVQLPSECLALDKVHAQNDHDERRFSIVALKTYTTDQSDTYFREMEAFRYLQSLEKPATGIIECYGSFRQNETYTLVQEMSSGNLFDVMKSEPPRNPDHILRFWKQISDLSQGLATIHNMPNPDSHGTQARPFHGDIKPENILCFKAHDGTEYERFAFADFGMSLGSAHQTPGGNSLRIRNIDSPSLGLRLNPSEEGISDPTIGQKYDIWCLGTLYLEFVTWFLCGYNEAQDSLFDSLHDDYESCIDQVTAASWEASPGDFITPEMLQIARKMLNPEPSARPSAIQVFEWCMNILLKAERQRQSEISPQSAYPSFTMQQICQWRSRKKLQAETRLGRECRGNQPMDETKDEAIDELRSRLERRDHIFLVDDSRSMSNHWTQVTSTIQALAYLVKDMDPDGMELQFSSSPRTLRSRHSTPLVKALHRYQKSGQFVEQTGLVPSITKILEKRVSSHERHGQSSRGVVESQTRPTSIFVFTDGTWDSKKGELDRLQSVARSLEGLNPQVVNQVSIQFIRFGKQNDCGGIKTVMDILKTPEEGIDVDGKKEGPTECLQSPYSRGCDAANRSLTSPILRRRHDFHSDLTCSNAVMPLKKKLQMSSVHYTGNMFRILRLSTQGGWFP